MSMELLPNYRNQYGMGFFQAVTGALRFSGRTRYLGDNPLQGIFGTGTYLLIPDAIIISSNHNPEGHLAGMLSVAFFVPENGTPPGKSSGIHAVDLDMEGTISNETLGIFAVSLASSLEHIYHNNYSQWCQKVFSKKLGSIPVASGERTLSDWLRSRVSSLASGGGAVSADGIFERIYNLVQIYMTQMKLHSGNDPAFPDELSKTMFEDEIGFNEFDILSLSEKANLTWYGFHRDTVAMKNLAEFRELTSDEEDDVQLVSVYALDPNDVADQDLKDILQDQSAKDIGILPIKDEQVSLSVMHAVSGLFTASKSPSMSAAVSRLMARDGGIGTNTGSKAYDLALSDWAVLQKRLGKLAGFKPLMTFSRGSQ